MSEERNLGDPRLLNLEACLSPSLLLIITTYLSMIHLSIRSRNSPKKKMIFISTEQRQSPVFSKSSERKLLSHSDSSMSLTLLLTFVGMTNLDMPPSLLLRVKLITIGKTFRKFSLNFLVSLMTMKNVKI